MLRDKHSIGLALLATSVVALTGCRPETPTDLSTATTANREFSGDYPIKVVCTTGPVTDMLRNLGGEHLEVTGLMGPGVDPHLYTAVPADIERLDEADAVFYNGLHLEGRMADVFENLGDSKPTFAVTDSLAESKDPRLRKPPEFEGYYDPHVWHDPKMWADCVKYVAKVLGEFDPDHRADYDKNRDVYLKQLEEADQYCRDQLATIPEDQRVLVSVHDAFNYFCSAYDIVSMPLKGVSTEEEVTIGRMEEVVQYLVDNKIKAVFIESASKPQVVEALIDPCRRKGHAVRFGETEDEPYVLYADALGPASSGADNYLGMIKANVDTLVSALK
jgi:manganese/zinc/iron transport system substrate-binding protein